MIAIFLFILMGFQYDPLYDLSDQLLTIYNPLRKDYVVLIDYSKSIDEERLFVVDMKLKKVIMKSRVSHAYNSGSKYAVSFSNKVGTKKSSIGAFLTMNSYNGKWGYAMRIKGLDGSKNDNTLIRAIVFHSDIVQKTTWSEGCFATPHEFNKKLIDLVQGGCLVYVYY